MVHKETFASYLDGFWGRVENPATFIFQYFSEFHLERVFFRISFRERIFQNSIEREYFSEFLLERGFFRIPFRESIFQNSIERESIFQNFF
jgi:hypothetical protein